MKKGFGIIELLISTVLLSIVMIGLYQYTIKSTKTATHKTRITADLSRLRSTFTSITGELQLAGYNPEDIAVGGVSPFILKNRPSGLSSLEFSSYNPDHPACTSGPECSIKFHVDGNGTLIKTYWDETSSASAQMTVLNNACVLFLYCDSSLEKDPAKKSCYCSPDSGINCSAQSFQRAKLIKLVIASVAKEEDVSGFDSSCNHSALEKTEYVRMEKRIYLSNMR